MLLAIDIGNTSISFAVMKGMRLARHFSVKTQGKKMYQRNEISMILGRIQRKYPNIEGVILCSVVPQALELIQGIIGREYERPLKVVGKSIKVPIKNKYRIPRQVGQDRLVCAYAAKCLYGAPAIIVDFGTATTFDVLSKNGHYEGGIIIPGIRLTTDSLHSKTAMLPRISTIKRPKSLIGKNTKESILSGIFYGYGSMSSGLIERISKKFHSRPNIIVTGGHTDLMRPFISSRITKIDKSLVFKGLALLSKSS